MDTKVGILTGIILVVVVFVIIFTVADTNFTELTGDIFDGMSDVVSDSLGDYESHGSN